MNYRFRLLLALYAVFLLCWGSIVYAGLPGACEGTTTANLSICIPRTGQTPWSLEYADMVNKVDAHAGSTSAHGATSANTPSTTVRRDASGNFSAGTITGTLIGNATSATTATSATSATTATTAIALVGNGTNCGGNNFALGVDTLGNAECAQPSFSNLSGAATDAQVPDDITVTGYLPLAAGSGAPLTGQLFLDNLGIEAEESDTNPTCAAGRFSVYADASENKWKKCENGVISDLGAVSGSSGDISDVWGCGTGDCSTIVAASGDSLDAGNATSISPTTRSTSLPGTCSEGQHHQDTDSGGAETYVCTAPNVWTKLLSSTDNTATATALAANPTDCGANTFATTIDASGNLTCASPAGTGKAVADTGGTGIVAQTGAATSAARTITGTSGNITVTNGDGVAGNPTLNVDTTVVQTDQSNTYSTGNQDFSAATSLKIVSAAGASPTSNGNIAYDSTSHTFEGGVNTANKTFAMTDGNIATATALAANGSNCAAGSFPLGVDASGASESCTDVAVQTELDSHASSTAAHSATSANTADRIVLRDGSGDFAAGTITAALSGNATTATALAANGGNCSGDNFALGVDASGVGECAQPAFSNLSGSATDAQVADTITASNYLPLAGGTLTGQLITDNLGVEFEDSDTNPSCASGNFSIYADLSELKLKKCEDGVASDIGATAGSSGDVTDVWGCATGDCSALTASAGDSLDATSADSMIPQPVTATLPATCTEGQHYQDNNSGGTETYVCTAADTWVKFIASTDNVATATALAANGANCSAGSFPLGVDTAGAAESCTDGATQTELDAHAAVTTAVHGSTSSNTANRIVERDASGNFSAQTITASLSGNATTATNLAANGTNCSAGNFPLGVDASGSVESCTDGATQTELNTHEALTATHGAVSTNTASRIVLRDGSGNFSAGTITATLAGNASTATALAANGANCSAGEFPLGVNAAGVVESCTDSATQTELDTHANNTTTAHGATTANTASTIVLRNGSGGVLWESSVYDVSTLPTCDSNAAWTYLTVRDSLTAGDCSIGGGGIEGTLCKCDGTAWVSATSDTVPGVQDVYNASGTTPTLTAGTNGLKLSGFNTLTKGFKLCNAGAAQCKTSYVDEAGVYQETFTLPVDLVTKLYSTKSWELKDSSDNSLLKVTDAGVVSGSAKLVRGLGTPLTTDVDIASSSTETKVYEVTIPGGTLGTANCVRFTMDGVGLGNVATPSWSIRMKYAGSFGTSVANAQSQTASSRYSYWQGMICGDGSTSAQRLSFIWTLSGTASASYGTVAIDSTADQLFGIYVTQNTASASMTWKTAGVIAEIIPAS